MEHAKHVVSVGGGIASTFLLTREVVRQHGPEAVKPVIAVLPNEHPDTWRLCDAVEARYNVPFTYIAYDKTASAKWRYVKKSERDDLTALWTPFDVFYDQRFVGSSMIDPCSRMLKRETLRRYMADTCPDKDVVLNVGIGAHEVDRRLSIELNWRRAGYMVAFPLIDQPQWTRDAAMNECRAAFGFVPELYELGFSHNNCGGACIKAGMREWARLLWYKPDTYAEWELAETMFRARFGDYAMLRDRSGGTSTPLPLYTLRRRLEADWSGILPGFEEAFFERLPTQPACSFCAAVA